MANTKMLVIYIFFLISFNLFSVSFIAEEEDTDFSLENFKIFGAASEKLIQKDNIIAKTLGYLSLPFIAFDIMIYIMVAIGYGFTYGNPILNTLLYVPFSIIITIDYILPLIRGN